MTEVKMSGPSEMAEQIAREMTEEERAHGLTCFVRHPDAGGKCKRPASMLVYDLHFCKIHGEETRIGALGELYHDAAEALERMDNPHAPLPNVEAAHILANAADELTARCRSLADLEDEAMLRAYPLIEERMCTESRNYDYSVINEDPYPEDSFGDVRHELHSFMRQAFEKNMIWLIEILEHERETCSAQAAFAMRLRIERAGGDGVDE